MKYLRKKICYLVTSLLISSGTISCEMSTLEDPILADSSEETETTAVDELGANYRIGPNLLFEETFEGENSLSTQSMQFSSGHSFNVVTDPASSTNKVGRFELRNSDPVIHGGLRAEVGFRDAHREAWYSYRVFFPTSGYNKDNNPEAITQWHQAGGGSPPNAVHVKDDKIFLRSINRSDTKDNSNAVYTNYDLGNVERGKWNEYVFHYIHSPNSDGLIEIWHNNRKIHTVNGPNMRRGYDLPRIKIGVYKWGWAREKTQSSVRVLYFDNVRVGNANATLNDLVSDGQQPVQQNVTPVVESSPKPEVIGGVETGSTTGQGITGFNLIQANIDKDLGALSNGAVVETSTHKLNIRANTPTSFNGEVQFKLSGTTSKVYTDRTAPFSLFGDDGRGDYYFGTGLPSGSYTLEATPFSEGRAGSTVKIQFTIRN